MFIHNKRSHVADPENIFSDLWFLCCPVSFCLGTHGCRNSSSKKAAGDTGVVRQKRVAISTIDAFRKYSQIKHYNGSVKGESFYSPRLVSVRYMITVILEVWK